MRTILVGYDGTELSWFDWDTADTDLLEFTRRLIRFRREHPVFRRARFLTGRQTTGSGLPDVWWFRPDGRRMTRRDWAQEDARTLGVFLNGAEIPSRTLEGERIVDDSFLLFFNAHDEPVTFTVPARRLGEAWEVALSTDPGVQSGSYAYRAPVGWPRARSSFCSV